MVKQQRISPFAVPNGDQRPSLRQLSLQLIKTFGPDLWADRRRLLLGYLYTFFAVGALLLVPWPLQMIIDHVLTAKSPPPAVLGALSPDLQIAALALAAVVIALARVTFTALEKITNAQVRERFTVTLRDRLLLHVQNLPLAQQPQQRSGELVLCLVGDVNLFARLLTKALPVTLNHALTTLSTLAVMFWLEPRLALIGVAVLAILVWLTRRYAGPLHAASRAKRRREGEVSGLAQEIVRSLPTTQALGLGPRTRKRFREVNRDSLRAGVEEVRVAVSMERMMALTRSVALALISAGGALLVLRNALTVGELTVFLTYMSQLLRPAEKANEQLSSIVRGLARGEQLLHLLEQAPLTSDRPGAVDIGRARGIIELRAVSFTHLRPNADGGQNATAKTPQPLLSQIDLRIEPGSLYVLAGASGSGKSTLINLLLRLYQPDSGEILLDGRPLQEFTLASLRRQFAVMVQHTHLFAGTLREALSADGKTDAELWHALEQVGLADAALPGGLDAPLGEDGLNLSGGQRARLSLARTLLLERPILLLDEPTANVDPASRELILTTLEQLCRRRTCLVVSHQQELIGRADRVLHLINGRLVAEVPGGGRLQKA